MSKLNKEECPECSQHTIVFSPEASKVIYELHGQGISRRKKRSIEQVVNKLIEKSKVKTIEELFE